MESFYQLLRHRRSCRTFKAQTPDKELIDRLLKTALMSPASKRSNPWYFVVVDEPEVLKKLAQCKPHGSKLIAGAPMAIVVAADPDKSDVWVEDCSIASIILQLAAEDLGLGSCWVQIRKRQHHDELSAEEYIKNMLDIPENLVIESVVAVGYKAEQKAPFNLEKLLRERVTQNGVNTKYELDD